MTGLMAKLRSRTAPVTGNGNGAAGHARARRHQARRARYILTRAESAACTCPDFCERDHETD
jgi:hypothetical protein